MKKTLGDNGSYYFSSIIGLLLIYLQNKLNLNPFVVANILAHPTYECLFSYLRRIFNKKKLINLTKTFTSPNTCND